MKISAKFVAVVASLGLVALLVLAFVPDTSNFNPAQFSLSGTQISVANLNASVVNSGTINAGQFPALTGDVTTPGGSFATTISAGAVTLGKMANETANTVIGNNTGVPATPLNLTPSQVLDIIGSTRGAVLERGAGGWVLINPGASGTFLGGNGAGADPTYQTPPGGGSVISAGVDIYTNTSSGTIAINLNTNMTNIASAVFTNGATLTGGTGSGLLYSNNNGTVSLSSGLGVFTNTATGADFKTPTNQAAANMLLLSTTTAGDTTYSANGGFLTNLSGGALTGAVAYAKFDASALFTNTTLPPAAAVAVTCGAASGSVQGNAGITYPFFWPLSITATNQWTLQWDPPNTYGGGPITISFLVVSATNANNHVGVVFSAATSFAGAALGTPVTVTNNLPTTTGFCNTNVQCINVVAGGTAAPTVPMYIQLQSWGGQGGWTETNLDVYLERVQLSWTNSATQNALLNTALW